MTAKKPDGEGYESMSFTLPRYMIDALEKIGEGRGRSWTVRMLLHYFTKNSKKGANLAGHEFFKAHYAALKEQADGPEGSG